MRLNVPVLALSVVGVMLVGAGLFTERTILLVGLGVATIIAAWLLQEASRRRAGGGS